MMGNLVAITDVDRRIYTERLRDWLPDELVDIHTHVWRASDYQPGVPARGQERSVTWPARVAKDNPIEDLQETYRLMLPGKKVTPLIFANIPQPDNLERINAYVADCSRRANVPALIFSDPSWSASELEERTLTGRFLGAKSYLSLAPPAIPAKDISIFDFFPREQLAVHDRHGWLVMLHLPRDGRLKDPLNLAQLQEIERDFPNLQLIVAHVGRAYCHEDVGEAFHVLAGTERMCFDISANTNDWVFEQLLRGVGPRRVLFGTDLPILRMRMKRITRDDRYIIVVPKGLYGDVSGDKNMAEVEGMEAKKLTFFLYEELDAFRRAAARVGLTANDVADVFRHNALRLLAKAGWKAHP
ncbi:MAG TPA: amidohydrolase family protein [Armatimonadota bacterium]|jgi:predicted TIM-barrel fold metal-dependent hydrolase